MEAVRIIKEMEEQSGGLGPTFAIWENVPGAFSSNGGKDFHAVLEELARIKEPEVSIPRPENGKWAKAGVICGNGWSIAWRTFDAQFWGVPQRRRRIALVLDLRGQRAGEILFERTGVSGNPEPSIPPWKGIARDPAHGAAGHDRVVALQGNMIDREVQQNGSGVSEGETMFTLNTTDRHGVCCAAFTAGQGAKANGIGWEEEQAPTLCADGRLSAMPTVLHRMRGFGDYVPDKKASSVKARDCKDATDLIVESIPEHATLGSLFDGIGGFPLVWETCHGKGTAVWASEIEEFPIAVTKARFPE